MAQQGGGEGADRIQGFQAAPVVDQERGKTLGSGDRVKLLVKREEQKNYEFKDSLLKLLKSLNSGLPAAQKRYISATIPRTQDTKIHGKRKKGLL